MDFSIFNSIAFGVLINGIYDLIKESNKITVNRLKSMLITKLSVANITLEQERALQLICSLLEQIPEEYKSSPEAIQNYLMMARNSHVTQNVCGKGSICINGPVNNTFSIGGVHHH